ncbi:gamma-glutamyltransferase family protein [Glaciihabitans sp. dw_435]|uniref:gamma-glutamyltransferase family protein n=1 Tax=Glaciihabitans sp. dw_435 TaxID=2720081 RepID=UPI001BD65F62|nr:gamma-glutamyltransferase [Glaciihabitans sp. dw_435]
MSSRQLPRTFGGAVATPHVLATDAAEAVLAEGGSAIDAAIAAAAVLTVVYPHNVALGGDLIALVRTPDGVVRCVNASGRAPQAQTGERLRAVHGSRLPARGVDTVTIPGGVRGWDVLHGLGGQLPWSHCFDAAVVHADEGVPVARDLARNIAEAHGLLASDPGAGALFVPGGRPLGLGDALRQPRLAETFRRLQRHGAEDFYTGDIAAQLVAGLRAHASVATLADFARQDAQVEEPISGTFGRFGVHTSGPNTQGFMVLRALAALEGTPIADPLGAGLGELMSIFRDANALRDELLADPEFAAVDLARLLDPRSELSRSTASLARPGVPRAAGDTVGISVLDADGMAVSLIQSVYWAFGSGVLEPNTGVLFHNRGTSFSLDPASPNVIEPGKRPRHTLMPLIVTEGEDLRLVLAAQGGQGQPQVHTQLLLRLWDGADVSAAVDAPRAIVGVSDDGESADTVFAEASVAQTSLTSISKQGMPVRSVPDLGDLVGQANAIAVGIDGVTAASDPRADGSAVVLSRGE